MAKVGEWLQEHKVLRVVEVFGDRVKCEYEDGDRVTFVHGADKYLRNTEAENEQKVTRTSINDMVKNTQGQLLTIEFTKTINVKKLVEVINDPNIKAKTQKEATELIKGEERKLTGICCGVDENGNLRMAELVPNEDKGFETQPRLVKPGNVTSVILGNTKYHI